MRDAMARTPFRPGIANNIAYDRATHSFYVSTLDRIRRVTAVGVVTTVTQRHAFPAFEGYDASNGAVYDPVDRNLYVSDGPIIERVSPVSGSVVTFAGRCIEHVSPGLDGCDGLQRVGVGTRALFTGPIALVADPNDGALYATEGNNNDVRRIDLQANVTTLAGDGIAAIGMVRDSMRDSIPPSPSRTIRAGDISTLPITSCIRLRVPPPRCGP